MLDHAREAVQLTAGRAREDLYQDRILSLALVRLLEIVGEAASRVPREECWQHPEIPWPEIVSLRNRLIHGYDEVDLDVLWGVLTQDLPPLVTVLERILADIENPGH
ncbi:MAG: DUF86 domain-containing protein [Deltaproteobacteria bacterium]|nr:DUF86 domain-containing protein [Deltaproteobacteria bacterium]